MVYNRLLKTNFYREMTYKSNFFTFMIVNLVGYLGDVLFYILIYNFVDCINGWTKYHMLGLIATVWIIDSLNGGMFHMNVLRIPRYVQTYDLDFMLIKPINSRWYMSMKFVSYGLLLGVPFGSALLIYSMVKVGIRISVFKIILYVIALFSGTLIMHNIFFMITILSIKHVKVNALMSVFWSILEVGKYPEFIYPSKIRKIFVFIVPAIVIYNYPINILVNEFNILNVCILFSIAILFTLITQFTWKYFLKYYYK
ncbi:hypothetical protein CLTEP_11520 [Clostridium tepidiprofundi DSM 19306]|uniref:ABC-2 family transporter protein n=1 Tax=Clostridium tepidiprofundi DSM 19306 TaxID=1121338 RepID=A0A151B5A2_9CLOT|nr:ABC-2 family transporter protein [Clostridium tepidiprofundi]KYH34837.1 hypothetical protein CLTEP_11520 [Clostridium tepidiprofundi DSM 19306]